MEKGSVCLSSESWTECGDRTGIDLNSGDGSPALRREVFKLPGVPDLVWRRGLGS
jgi:hypothetical protein